MTNADDPLLPHLLDILSDTRDSNIILGGGYGIRLKQRYLNDIGAPTLIAEVPSARPTQDLDLFLRLELFLNEAGRAVREQLDSLGYEVTTENYMFGKEFDPVLEKYKVKVDLLARHPATAEEKEGVKVSGRRVGSRSVPSLGVHGRETEEAFAVENMPTIVEISGAKTGGTLVRSNVMLPHPYASLNMKVKAAAEWLKRGELEYKPGSEKHVYDVYILTAMLTPPEIEECATLSETYRDHPVAKENRNRIKLLFGTEGAPGFQEVRRQAGREYPLDYATFWEGLQQALGGA